MRCEGTRGHVKEVPIEAAHLVMMQSDLVWLFGSRQSRWHTPHLMLAARHFGVSLLPSPFWTAQRYEQMLLGELLRHLQSKPSHRFVVLYRLGSDRAGWVCLVPGQQLDRVQHVLNTFHLHLEAADPSEVLQ